MGFSITATLVESMIDDDLDHDELDERVASLLRQGRFDEYLALARGLAERYPDDEQLLSTLE